MKLGTIISRYKYNKGRIRSATGQHDIEEIVKRLEGYQKYKEQIRLERKNKVKRLRRKTNKLLKKAAYQKYYSKKPVYNPYLQMYSKMHTAPDPRLLERYKQKHLYSLYEFRYMLLPKSGYKIKAGHAWQGLIKAWKGYRLCKDHGDEVNMIRYASATQKWAYMLEAPMFPDFPEIGMSAAGFNNAKILQEMGIKEITGSDD